MVRKLSSVFLLVASICWHTSMNPSLTVSNAALFADMTSANPEKLSPKASSELSMSPVFAVN